MGGRLAESKRQIAQGIRNPIEVINRKVVDTAPQQSDRLSSFEYVHRYGDGEIMPDGITRGNQNMTAPTTGQIGSECGGGPQHCHISVASDPAPVGPRTTVSPLSS